MFTIALLMLAATGVFSIPLASGNTLERVRATTITISGLAVLAGCAGLAYRHRVYLWLRARPGHQVTPAAVGGLILLADSPYAPTWWIALALTLGTAAVGTARVTLLGGSLASAGYATGVIMHGRSLLPGGDGEYLTVVFGLLVNPVIAHTLIDRFARFTLRLGEIERAVDIAATRSRGHLNVTATVTSATHGEPDRPGISRVKTASRGRHPRARRLTARQLEVLLLVRDGLHHPEIAECLGISRRQVERHLEQARERAGAATTAQLLAMTFGVAPAHHETVEAPPALPAGAAD